MKEEVKKVIGETDVEGYKANYCVIKAEEGYGVGISEVSPENVTRGDYVRDIFSTEKEAERFAGIMARNGVLSDSLRDILRDYFAEKVLSA